MEGDKVHGFGWFMLVWVICFILMCVGLSNWGCMPLLDSEKADSGAICMTPEMYRTAMDAACNEGYANGYQKAIAENSPADGCFKLYQDKAAVQELMNCTACERCVSGVPDEMGDPNVSCMDRASCLLSVARKDRYLGYIVVMNFTSDTTHAVVMFPTKTDGNVFVEPMLDLIVPTPIVGDKYVNKTNIIEKVVW